MYDVMVLPEMRVQYNLHLYLFRREAAGSQGMFFVDELDGDDGLGRVVWDGFADATVSTISEFLSSCIEFYGYVRSVCALSNRLTDEPEGEVRRQRSHLAVGRRGAHDVECSR